jgi:hypothetical protein
MKCSEVLKLNSRHVPANTANAKTSNYIRFPKPKKERKKNQVTEYNDPTNARLYIIEP